MELSTELKKWSKTIPVNSDQAILFLLAIKHNLNVNATEEIFEYLSKNKIIQRDFINNKIIVTIPIYEGELGEKLNIDSSVLNTIEERYQEYRILFKGIRSGSMGNIETVKEYLQRFCIQNNKTFDEVLNITERYIKELGGSFTPNADNFIYDIDKNNKERSKLKMAFEELEDEQQWRTIS